jgi:hypothetical protein
VDSEIQRLQQPREIRRKGNEVDAGALANEVRIVGKATCVLINEEEERTPLVWEPLVKPRQVLAERVVVLPARFCTTRPRRGFRNALTQNPSNAKLVYSQQ